MSWTVCFISSSAVLLIAVFVAIVKNIGKHKSGRIFTPFNIIFAGVFISAFISVLPINMKMLSEVSDSAVETALFSLHTALQIFTLGADKSIILENISCSYDRLASAYSVYLSIIFVAAPILTFGFILSFFKNALAYIKYFLSFFKDVYIFSELNEKSVALGGDIKRNHKKAAIVYTGVYLNSDEVSELYETASKFGAICFKKDILSVKFKLHKPGACISFFTVSENETLNEELGLKLTEIYNSRRGTNLYVFSSGVVGELLLTKSNKGLLKVRRVNSIRSLVNRVLYDDGGKIFETATPISDDIKRISAVIVGAGQYGTEMLRALVWYCQMDGYEVVIDVFDKDPLAEDRFCAKCPELMSERYNGADVSGEAKYTVRFHSGFDVSTKSFADELTGLPDVTYAFVALGSDDINISCAVGLRTLFERMGVRPYIQSIVYSTNEAAALQGITNHRGQSYDIDFIGDVRSSYSENVIINSELEADALARHLKWGDEKSFWQYEYNYRSSVASAIHMKARIFCGIPGAEKTEGELLESERDALEILEHRRWNSYMRSEGYVYSGSPDEKSRNDLGKMHNDLVEFSLLDEYEKRKDSKVGTK